jgi:hypothetical protein
MVARVAGCVRIVVGKRLDGWFGEAAVEGGSHLGHGVGKVGGG